MKHEWRKKEKGIYLPKQKPEFREIPTFKFFTIHGEGNPNGDFFGECIGVLYALAYGVKMGLKKDPLLEDYVDYTVYPLEGVWDITDEAKKNFKGKLDKDTLVFDLMIRQPGFITKDYALKILEQVKQKTQNALLDRVKFERIEEGKCVQMLHLGSYDNEPASFEIMEKFAEEQKLTRISKVHREIYLSDARKTPQEKLKTVLRFLVK